MSSRVTNAFTILPAPDTSVEPLAEGWREANRVLPISIEALPMPAWVTSLKGQALLLNERAKALVSKGCLVLDEKPCQGVVQKRVIQGSSASGSSDVARLNLDVCQRSRCDGCCCLLEELQGKNNCSSGDLLIAVPEGAPRWFRVFVSTYQDSASHAPLLLHLAFDVDKAHKIESYFERIVARSGQNANHHRSLSALTRREKEVLDMLAADETLWGIADRLCLSYSTVRNHVRNILAKFGVHSIIEAVALYLTAS